MKNQPEIALSLIIMYLKFTIIHITICIGGMEKPNTITLPK